jgi:hypothetical protein
MKLIKSLIAALLAIFTLAAVPATAQVWAPPPAWGPGWRHWIGHHPAAPGWYGPVWYAPRSPLWLVSLAWRLVPRLRLALGGDRTRASGAATDRTSRARARPDRARVPENH